MTHPLSSIQQQDKSRKRSHTSDAILQFGRIGQLWFRRSEEFRWVGRNSMTRSCSTKYLGKQLTRTLHGTGPWHLALVLLLYFRRNKYEAKV